MDLVLADVPAPPVWRALLSYLRPHRLALVLGGLLSLVTSAAGLALPLVARDLIGAMADGRPVTTAVVMSSAGAWPTR